MESRRDEIGKPWAAMRANRWAPEGRHKVSARIYRERWAIVPPLRAESRRKARPPSAAALGWFMPSLRD